MLLSLLPRRRKDFGSLQIVDLPKKKLKTAKIKLPLCSNGGFPKPHCRYDGSILRSFPTKHAPCPLDHHRARVPAETIGNCIQVHQFFGYISQSWPTCRTVAKILRSHGHLHSAVCNARPIANVWQPCRPRLRTNTELSTSSFQQIYLHEFFGPKLGWSLEIDSARSIWWKCMDLHHIPCVILYV